MNKSAARNKFFLFFFSFCFFNSTVLFAQRQHLLFENSFEGSAANDAYLTGTIGGAMQNDQHCCSYSIQKATNNGSFTARAGTGAVRYELNSTDPVVSQSLRAELTMPNGYTDVGERWYGFSYYFENWQSDSRVSHELQWHPDNSTGAAELQLRTTNNQYTIVHGTQATGYHHDDFPAPYGTVVSNVWADFVFHVKFAADNTGFLQVWKDGVLLVNESNIVTSEPEGQYIKIGINNWTWYEGNVGTVTQRIFYIDEIRVGDALATYCDVAPDIPNDRALGATLLTPGSGCTGAIYANNCASRNTGESTLQTCSGITEAPAWFKFAAPASGAVRITTDVGSGNTFPDSKVSLYSATDSNNYSTFSVIACDDDGGSVLGTGLMSVVYATGLTSGSTYYIAVDKKTSTTPTGSFCITVDELNSSMLATTNTCASTFQTPVANGTTTYTGWQPLMDGNSKLIALVRNPSGGPVDGFTVSQNINTAAVRTDAASGEKYLNRSFTINNSTATNVNVQFFFLNSELNSLGAVDPAATLGNLRVTRQTGTACQANFAAANGTNSELLQTGNGSSTDGLVKWIQVTTPGFSNFFIHSTKSPLIVKTFLQGAYEASLGRHKDVTPGWAAILNANVLNQPYNTAAFGNYNGGESVSSGFFTSNATHARDVVDWVLLEVKDASLVTVARRAAFVREDGKIVDINGDSLVTFNGLGSGNFYLTVRHRNHLAISVENLLPVTAKALGLPPPTSAYNFDFTTAPDANIFGDALAYKVVGGNNVMICGNANSNTAVRYAGLNNDPASILVFLGSAIGGISSNVYSANDVNLDGTVRYAGLNNDPGFLLSNSLGGAIGLIVNEQKR
jgi:hypothetical protein